MVIILMLENVMIWRFFSSFWKNNIFFVQKFRQITTVLSYFAGKCCKLTIYYDVKNCTFFNDGPEMFEFWRQKSCSRFFWQFFNHCENLLEFLTFNCGIRAVICDAVILFFLNTTLVRIHVWLLLLLTRPSTEQYKSQKPYINLFSIKRRDKDKEEAAVETLVNSP